MHPTLKRMTKSLPTFLRNWSYQKKIRGSIERHSNEIDYINYIKNCNSDKQVTELQSTLKKRVKKSPKNAPTPISRGEPKSSHDDDPYNMVDPVDREFMFP